MKWENNPYKSATVETLGFYHVERVILSRHLKIREVACCFLDIDEMKKAVGSGYLEG
jgi:hypothetical protein